MERFSRRDIHVDVIAVLTAAILAAVVLHPGVATHVVDLHGGGVRTTSRRMVMVAHLSYRSQTLNRGLRTSSTSFGIDQSDSQVITSDTSSGTYTQIDDITPFRATDSGSTTPTLVSRRFRPRIC